MENVILVDKKNQILDLVPKKTAHTNNTKLHRGFSIFIFNFKNQLLLQQRSSQKITWPLFWSNSCCGHPDIFETSQMAAKRRVKFELGIDLKLSEIKMVKQNYQYCFSKDKIMENEICPIMFAISNQTPQINPSEVENYKFEDWSIFLKKIKSKKSNFSPWCQEEALFLEKWLNLKSHYF